MIFKGRCFIAIVKLGGSVDLILDNVLFVSRREVGGGFLLDLGTDITNAGLLTYAATGSSVTGTDVPVYCWTSKNKSILYKCQVKHFESDRVDKCLMVQPRKLRVD